MARKKSKSKKSKKVEAATAAETETETNTKTKATPDRNGNGVHENGNGHSKSNGVSTPRKIATAPPSSSKASFLMGFLAILVGCIVAVWQKTAPDMSFMQFYSAKSMKLHLNKVLDSLKFVDDDDDDDEEEDGITSYSNEDDGPDYSYRQPKKFSAPIEREKMNDTASSSAASDTTPVGNVKVTPVMEQEEKTKVEDVDTATAEVLPEAPEPKLDTAALTATTSTAHQPWKLVGSKLVGPHNRSQFGFSVDLSNDLTLVIGIPGWKNDTGAAQVYTFGGKNVLGDDIENEWVPSGDLLEAPEGDLMFGRSVSYNSDSGKIAVGGHGAAAVYKATDENVWTVDHEDQPLLKRDVKADGYGFQVALRGEYLVLSEPGHDNTRGAVYTLEEDSYEDVETVLGKNQEDQSGVAVRLNQDGTILAVGSPMYTKNQDLEKAGHVRVLQWDDVEGWRLKGNDIVGVEAHDWSGQSVALNGDGTIVAIGSPGHDEDTLKDARADFFDEIGEIDGEVRSRWAKEEPERLMAPGNDAGQVRVFKYNDDTRKWERMGKDLRGEEKGDQFGFSVSLSEDGMTMATSGLWNRGDPSNKFASRSGHVRVWRYDGSNWNQMGPDIDGDDLGDWFGQSVELSPDGKKMAVGAICRNNGWQGYVKVYELTE